MDARTFVLFLTVATMIESATVVPLVYTGSLDKSLYFSNVGVTALQAAGSLNASSLIQDAWEHRQVLVSALGLQECL